MTVKSCIAALAAGIVLGAAGTAHAKDPALLSLTMEHFRNTATVKDDPRADATTISTDGREYGVICSRALSRVNQSVFLVTVSPRSSGTSTSIASSIMSRWRATGMPIMKASDGRAPGPTPNMTRPRVM